MAGERHEDRRRMCCSSLTKMQGQGPRHEDSDIELNAALFRKNGNFFSVTCNDMAGGKRSS